MQPKDGGVERDVYDKLLMLAASQVAGMSDSGESDMRGGRQVGWNP